MKTLMSFLTILAFLFVACAKEEVKKKPEPSKVAEAEAMIDTLDVVRNQGNPDDTIYITSLNAMRDSGYISWEVWNSKKADVYRSSILFNSAIRALKSAYENWADPNVLLPKLDEARHLTKLVGKRNTLEDISNVAGIYAENLRRLQFIADSYEDAYRHEYNAYHLFGHLYLFQFSGDRWVELIIDTTKTELYLFPTGTKETHLFIIFKYRSPEEARSMFWWKEYGGYKIEMVEAEILLDENVARRVWNLGVGWGHWPEE